MRTNAKERRSRGLADKNPRAAQMRRDRDAKYAGADNFRIPVGWGDLPLTAGLRSEVEWVHGNYESVVIRKEGKLIGVDLEYAHTPAPSLGSLRMLYRATVNPSGFDSLALKVRSGKVDDEEEAKEDRRHERKSLEEIRQYLEAMIEAKEDADAQDRLRAEEDLQRDARFAVAPDGYPGVPIGRRLESPLEKNPLEKNPLEKNPLEKNPLEKQDKPPQGQGAHP